MKRALAAVPTAIVLCDGHGCEAGFVCDEVAGSCVQCTDDSECGMGFSCFNQLCVDTAVSGSCEQPTDYQIGSVVTGDTSRMSNHQANNGMMDDCSGTDGAGPEFVFSFVPEQSGFACFTTDESVRYRVACARRDLC